MNILDIAIAKKLAGGGGGSGTDNYNDLSNLPKINDTTLSGNKSSSALGLQSEINSDSKLASDLVDDTNQDNKFVTSTEKNTWNGKQNAIDADHKLSSDLVDDANKTNKFVTSTEKNTWNAKQNAIDSDHKLSSSLVSFSTAEAAALASGIDSSKVEQISTNQTNILSVQNDVTALEGNKIGVNNFNIGAYVTNPNVTVVDGSLIVNKSVTLPITVPKTGKYYLLANVSNVSIGSGGLAYLFVRQSTTNLLGITFSTTGDISGEFTVTDVSALSFLFSFNSASVTIKDIMIVSEEAYNAGFTSYQPYALPNYDLTQLQSEDRAALAEVVDNGAKNKFDFSNSTIVREQYTTTTKTSDNLVVACTGAVWAFASLAVGKFTGNSTFTFKISELSNSGASPYVRFTKNQDGSSPILDIAVATNDTYTANFVGDGSDYYICIYLNPSATSQTVSLKMSDIMICDTSEYNVSPTVVPYALPNTDLTQEVNALHERTDQIQEIAHLVPSTSGWYRVFAMENVATATAAGASDNSCNITIKREFVSNNNEHHEIKLIAIYPYKSEFTDEFSKSNSFLTTKIRQVVTTNSTYIDIYYAGTEVNSISCILTGSIPIGSEAARWRAINNVSAVPETTTGETIVASYDFNANDDKKAPGLNSVVMESGSLNDLSTSFIVCTGNVTDKPLDAYVWGFVRTTVSDSNTALQEFFAFSSTDQSYNGMAFVRVKQGGTWKSWKQITNA